MRNFFVRVCVKEKEGRKEGGIMALNFISQGFINIQPTNTELKVTALPLSLSSPSLFPHPLAFLSFFFSLPRFVQNFLPWEDFEGDKKVHFFVLFSLVQFPVITFSALFCPSGQIICPFTHSILYPPPTQPLGARERSLEGFKRLLSRAAQAARRTASGN